MMYDYVAKYPQIDRFFYFHLRHSHDISNCQITKDSINILKNIFGSEAIEFLIDNKVYCMFDLYDDDLRHITNDVSNVSFEKEKDLIMFKLLAVV